MEEKKNETEVSKTEQLAKEAVAEEKEKEKSDFETWFPPLKFIDTIGGERVKIPPVSAGKEAKVFQALGRLLSHLPKKINWGEFSADDLLAIAPKLLKEAPEEAFYIGSLLLDKEPKWVADNLDMDRIFSLILPFVGREAKLFTRVIGAFTKVQEQSPLGNL
ncbi:hypothetical protein ES703_01622 [subsurface metagenome]